MPGKKVLLLVDQSAEQCVVLIYEFFIFWPGVWIRGISYYSFYVTLSFDRAQGCEFFPYSNALLQSATNTLASLPTLVKLGASFLANYNQNQNSIFFFSKWKTPFFSNFCGRCFLFLEVNI